MKYHARIEYSSFYTFYNYSEEAIINDVVVPFVNGQVVLLNTKHGPKLFNMKNATFVKIYKTKVALKATEDKSIIEQIKEESFAEYDCTAEVLGKVQSRYSAKALSSLIQKALQPSKQQIFVVMKFGDEEMDSAYAGAYKAVANEFGLDCVRIDEVQDSGKISDQILEQIAESKYVLCDLTGARPNCYYETGFAHALGKELILLSNKKEKIHFDLEGHRFIQWSSEEDLRKKLRARFAALESSRSRED
ncbi:hypothetical protein ACFQUU_06140 [Herbaspirillum sp. GCM10030257]|uniref:hypothetical protein n=1 Tax=Herbaspirillum sp. GCM10030257 TaxID=3273393 RepID=UPI00361975F8